MYLKMAEDEDNKMTDRWQKDADGILIFVSAYIALHSPSEVTNMNTVDWFILGFCRGIGRGLSPGPQAKFTGYLSILSREHLSTSRRPKRISCIYPCHSSYATTLLSTEISSLGQLALVPQFGHESYICATGDIVTAVGASIHQNHSTTTVQSTQASTDPCVLC
jgi:hypothetical protein